MRCLRISKLWASTFFWAFSMAREISPWVDRLAFFHLQHVHDLRDPLGAEDPQQIVLQGQIEP